MSLADEILQLASKYESNCHGSLVKLARIRQLTNGKYRVFSRDGVPQGTFTSKDKAKKKLKELEYARNFDHQDAKDGEVIDLTDADDFTYSAIMRKMRKSAPKEVVQEFLAIFKQHFDRAVQKKLQKPERVALQNALVRFNKIHKVKINTKLVKNAAVAELGNAQQVGAYLANIVKFTLSRVDPAKRYDATISLQKKFNMMDAGEVSTKNLPQSAAVGQAITFVKHVLFGHDAKYVRDVLDSLVRSL